MVQSKYKLYSLIFCFLSFSLFANARDLNQKIGAEQVQTLAEVVRPQYSTEFIVQKLLSYKNKNYDDSIALPQVIYKSETTLEYFQKAIESQWGFKPDEITNAYVVQTNQIFLNDDKQYYDQNQRCIDDSLAHELTHFYQAQYQKYDLNDEFLEIDAIEFQNWFRENFCQVQP